MKEKDRTDCNEQWLAPGEGKPSEGLGLVIASLSKGHTMPDCLTQQDLNSVVPQVNFVLPETLGHSF